jgi:hypothetical protein
MLPHSLSRPLLLLALVAGLTACKENGNDYLQEGLRLLGEAERGDCKPEVENGQPMINGAKVAQCLDKTKAALDQLYKARELGVKGGETDNLIAKTEDEVKRLESMLKMVTRMQHEP